jgi:hypothetical protein
MVGKYARFLFDFNLTARFLSDHCQAFSSNCHGRVYRVPAQGTRDSVKTDGVLFMTIPSELVSGFTTSVHTRAFSFCVATGVVLHVMGKTAKYQKKLVTRNSGNNCARQVIVTVVVTVVVTWCWQWCWQWCWHVVLVVVTLMIVVSVPVTTDGYDVKYSSGSRRWWHLVTKGGHSGNSGDSGHNGYSWDRQWWERWRWILWAMPITTVTTTTTVTTNNNFLSNLAIWRTWQSEPKTFRQINRKQSSPSQYIVHWKFCEGWFDVHLS